MWSNRPTPFLYVSLRSPHGHRFAWPLPLFSLTMLLDIASDWGVLARPFAAAKGKTEDYKTFRRALGALSEWLYELMFRSGPQTLLELDTEEDNKRFFLKCCLK